MLCKLYILGGLWDLVTTYTWAYNPGYNPPTWAHRGCPNYTKGLIASCSSTACAPETSLDPGCRGGLGRPWLSHMRPVGLSALGF